MIELKDRVAFLKKIHLFRDLKEDEIAVIAEQLKERSCKTDEVVFSEGDAADSLFFVYKGRVKITRTRKNKKIELATCISSDYFGEEGLVEHRKRSASVEVTEETLLLEIERADFYALLKKFSKLKPNFSVSIGSRRLARSLAFKWIAKNEEIYFIARKHPILLVQSLLGPAFALLLPLFLLAWGFFTNSLIAAMVSGILLLFIAGWVVWNVIDWGNDYYIVTNHRVIWLEKIIGVYDSRQEAPLSTVLSISVETDQTGRILDYGNVVVRTFVGKIEFHHVSHPYQAMRMIEEQWDRSKTSSSKLEKEAMVNSIRQKLGLTVKAQAEAPAPKTVIPHPQRFSLIRVALANMFKLRIEDSGVVTYRKHWYVLIQQIWQPTFFIIMIFILTISIAIQWWQSPDFIWGGLKASTALLSLSLVAIPFWLWWAYQYVDWKNDIFQVTPDQIMDLDRTPFGKEERRSAQIENILSTEYKRIGLTAYLLNYGTVLITVGGTQLSFQDVMDPAAVQSDIDLRRAARIAKKREAEVTADRERMSNWLAVYHENAQEFRAPDAETKKE